MNFDIYKNENDDLFLTVETVETVLSFTLVVIPQQYQL